MSGEQQQRTYPIPINFLDEGTILRGMFKTRNFIEAIIAAAIMFAIINSTVKSAYALAIGCGFVFFIFAVGVQGEPTSKFLLNVIRWRQTKGVMLYNGTATPLSKSPSEAMIGTSATQEALKNMTESIHKRFKDQTKEDVYVEGETFQFMEDKMLKDLVIDAKEIDESQIVTTLKEDTTEELDPRDIILGSYGIVTRDIANLEQEAKSQVIEITIEEPVILLDDILRPKDKPSIPDATSSNE